MQKRDQITLVCTSLGNNPKLLQKMVDSAKGFDSIIVHTNGVGFHFPGDYRQPSYKKVMTIPEAYNLIIGEIVSTQWVCCMCDDDYFYPEGLAKMIKEVHEGIIAGVAHFKFNVSGYMPKEDTRGRIHKRVTGKSEYVLWEKHPITPKLLNRHGRLPAASFFRKRAWEMVGGFQGDKCHDWDLWKRMAQNGIEFKYFDHLVYNYIRRPNSAWEKQNS